MKKKILVILAAAGIPVLLILFWFFVVRVPTPVIAFYGVEQEHAQAITEMVREYDTLPGFTTAYYDNTISLADNLQDKPTPTLLFSTSGKSLSEVSGRLAALDSSVVQSQPSTMRQAGKFDGTQRTYSLLLGSYEYLWNRQILANAGIEPPDRLETLIDAARQLQDDRFYPLMLAGGRDYDLDILVGSLIEAQGGTPAANAYAERAAESEGVSSELLDSILGSAPDGGAISLRSTLSMLIDWRDSKLLHPEWYRMVHNDLLAFMETSRTAFVFLPLRVQRSMSASQLSGYSSGPFPGMINSRNRSLFFTLITGGIHSDAHPENQLAARTTLRKLTSLESQEQLGYTSGLGPAHSNTPIMDRQAANARLWAAASRQILPPPTHAAFATEPPRAQLLAEIREYLAAEGVGW